jgi:hypothetical protein
VLVLARQSLGAFGVDLDVGRGPSAPVDEKARGGLRAVARPELRHYAVTRSYAGDDLGQHTVLAVLGGDAQFISPEC